MHFDKFLREMRAGDEIYLYDNSQQQPEDRLADVVPNAANFPALPTQAELFNL